jgi:hypothetical protein
VLEPDGTESHCGYPVHLMVRQFSGKPLFRAFVLATFPRYALKETPSVDGLHPRRNRYFQHECNDSLGMRDDILCVLGVGLSRKAKSVLT